MATEANIVVTLDIGGSGAKAVAYDAVRQRCVASAAVPYPGGGDGGDPGLFEPEDWWHAAVGALTELRLALTEPSRRCLGITVSAIRIPFVLIDRDGTPAMPGLLNRDRRAARQVADISAAAGADDVYRVTGHWLARSSACPSCFGRAGPTRPPGARRDGYFSCTTGSFTGCPAWSPPSHPRRP